MKVTRDPGRGPLILASASPRRRELLGHLGLAFEVRPMDIDETPRLGEAPAAYVARLAAEKAAAAARDGEWVLAADTIVVLDGEILGKPVDEADARAMLGRIAGRGHIVLTAVELRHGVDRAGTVEHTRVRMADLSKERIAWYVATGEPMDKAGAYGIQALGALLVEEVEGNYSNVVGLPLPATGRLFEQLGADLLEFRP
ncbi:MAG: Maf family protein [Acidobacteriota bacterium]